MNNARSRVAFRTCYRGNKTDSTRRTDGGFTIIETMIVLTVSTVLFMAAVILVAGQQRKVEFSQAIRDIQSNIQKTINEVNTGYYPNNGLSCSVSAGTLVLAAGATNQGSNTGCIFLGKALQFGVTGTDPQQYVTHTIAALQDNDGTIAGARPRDVAPGQNTNNAPDFPNASTTDSLHNGITAVDMTYTDGVGGTPQPIGAVAFVSQLGETDASTGQLLSGTQNIDLVPVVSSLTGPGFQTNTPQVVDAINNRLKDSPVNPSGGVSICFASGGTEQSGLVKIGGNGRDLAVTLDIKSTKDCT